MKKSLLPAGALVAAAGFALAPFHAHATAPTINDGDLILGFEGITSTGGTSGEELLVDLGSASQFLPGGSFAGINLSGDLSSVFGTGWASNASPVAGTPEVNWGVIGFDPDSQFNGDSTNSVFATKDTNVSSTPTDITQGGLNTAATRLTTFENAFGNDNSESDNSQAAQVSDNSTSSYTSFNPKSAAFGLTFGIEQLNADGPTNANLNLYEIQAGTAATPAANLGQFALSPAGELTFQAVPEPSTWASLLGGILFLGFFRRASSRRTRLS